MKRKGQIPGLAPQMGLILTILIVVGLMLVLMKILGVI